MLLSSDQLAAGLAILDNGKLTAPQVDDLTSIFRGILGELADNYSIAATLETEDDNNNNGARRAEKLAACLLLFQDNQFPEGGFAATPANRTGFNYDTKNEVFEIFKYCFGLYWTIPAELTNQFLGATASRKSASGRFANTLT